MGLDTRPNVTPLMYRQPLMGRSKRPKPPATPEEGWPWLAAQQRRIAAQRGRGRTTGADKRRAELDEELMARFAAQAAEHRRQLARQGWVPIDPMVRQDWPGQD